MTTQPPINTHEQPLNLNFRKIINDTDLKNYDYIKSYIEYSFKYKKAFKCHTLYINICKIYDQYPTIITNILDRITQLGYYKDYFLIMYHSRNNNLTAYIINLIHQQIAKDLINLKHNKPITTLGKWLPNEKSYINKRINFVDKFNILIFPHIIDKFKARKSYRMMKVNFNKQLGTIESKLCTKKYDEIDFNKVSPYALNLHKYTIQKHKECKNEYDQQHIKNLEKMNLNNFVKEIVTNQDSYTVDIINNIWKLNLQKYIGELPFINKLLNQNPVCVVDLSNETFLSGMLYTVYGLVMLVQSSSKVDNSIVIASKNPKKMHKSVNNLHENIHNLIKYCGPSNNIDVNIYMEFMKKNNYPENSMIIFITGKNLDIQSQQQYNILHCKLNDISESSTGKHMDFIYWDTIKSRTITHASTKNITKVRPVDIIKDIFINNPQPFYSKHWNMIVSFVGFLVVVYGIYLLL